MRILISGSTGMIGTALLPALSRDGHEIIRLVRDRSLHHVGASFWDPDAGELDLAAVGPIDAVVHLAGKNVAAGRWSSRLKQQIRDSRLNGTRLLSDTIAQMESKPSVIVSASAVGIYGNRGDELLREDAAPGTGFLADLTRDWEAALQPAAKAGIRTVALRISMALARQGGALPKLLPLFKAGLGGKLGSGRQYMSWIALPDLIDIIRFVLATSTISGPVNAVAPHPVTNLEFTKTLGRLLRRPTLCAVPAFALRLAVGDLADEGLLASARAYPALLLKHGFEFSCPDLETALRAALAVSPHDA